MEGSLLIDVSRLVGRSNRGRLPTGVDRVCLAYVARFGERAQAVLQWRGWRRILPWHDSQNLFALLRDPPAAGFGRQVAAIVAHASLPPWPVQEGRGRIFFDHGHGDIHDPASAAWLKQLGARPVFTVHDLIPISHPEYCRPGEGERHAARMASVLSLASALLISSEATTQALGAYAQARGLPLPPLQVAPLAPAALPPAPPGETAPLAQPYFVVLGTIEPRKNHWLLLHLWRELVREVGAERAPRLVVIGQRGWECENVVDLLERCEPLRGVVHELPGCSDAELARWLRHSRALLFPSFVEGYGLPLVESLMLGTPVIASPLPVFREIAGDIPDYASPIDGPAWRSLVLDYAADASPRAAAQRARLAGFEVPTWDRHFARVEALLERLG